MIEKVKKIVFSIYTKAVLLIVLLLYIGFTYFTNNDNSFDYKDFRVNSSLDQVANIEDILVTENGIKFKTDISIDNKECIIMNDQGEIYENADCILPITSELGYIVVPERISEFYMVLENYEYDKGDLMNLEIMEANNKYDINKMEYDNDYYEIYKIKINDLENNPSSILLNEPMSLDDLKKQKESQLISYIKTHKDKYINLVGNTEKEIVSIENQISIQEKNYKNDKTLSNNQREQLIYSIDKLKRRLEVVKKDRERFNGIIKYIK